MRKIYYFLFFFASFIFFFYLIFSAKTVISSVLSKDGVCFSSLKVSKFPPELRIDGLKKDALVLNLKVNLSGISFKGNLKGKVLYATFNGTSSLFLNGLATFKVKSPIKGGGTLKFYRRGYAVSFKVNGKNLNGNGTLNIKTGKLKASLNFNGQTFNLSY